VRSYLQSERFVCVLTWRYISTVYTLSLCCPAWQTALLYVVSAVCQWLNKDAICLFVGLVTIVIILSVLYTRRLCSTCPRLYYILYLRCATNSWLLASLTYHHHQHHHQHQHTGTQLKSTENYGRMHASDTSKSASLWSNYHQRTLAYHFMTSSDRFQVIIIIIIIIIHIIISLKHSWQTANK